MKIRTIVDLAVAGLLAVFCASACNPDEKIDTGVTEVVNPNADKNVSFRGATISVTFKAAAAWTASLDLKTGGEDWARISKNTTGGKAGNGVVRITFDENTVAEERVADLWIAVEGYEPSCICTIVQSMSGSSVEAEMNKALNTYMHEILEEDYLFADAYNSLDVDLTVNYVDFLPTHLLALGDVNIEDGGYYRASQDNAGERFIYSNIVEVTPNTKASNVAGLGFGPFISTALAPGSAMMGIAPSFVRSGSPAEAAGLRRGDLIYEVNGTTLTTSNYRSYMSGLYAGASGTYSFKFLRYEANGNGGYDHNAYEASSVAASVHTYNPVLHASVLTDPDKASVRIGYLVYESFDLYSQDFLEATIEEFVEEGITDMILDLRFNAGGAVAQSRWLSGCIAGDENGSKTFTKVVYNDGSIENWKFDYGYSNDTDNLGKPVDLGLDRLYVICSYNTASAAELVINSLRGIDFPVKLYGCRTEGKNVGMTVSTTTYKNRTFEFAPITFYVRNAKDFGDYPDGMEPDEWVNNDNRLSTDDADNAFPYSFADWGNLDFNIALQWAYCDITGKARWSTGTTTRASSGTVPDPADFCRYEPANGRYGNIIRTIDNH